MHRYRTRKVYEELGMLGVTRVFIVLEAYSERFSRWVTIAHRWDPVHN